VPSVEQNVQMWGADYDWSEAGDEWSARWGGSDGLWTRTLLPRVCSYLPATTLVEIAPGYGRWTRFLVDYCDRLVGVDIAANCVETCRRRFAAREADFHLTDGASRPGVADGTADFVFSFDSLVHAEADVLQGYIRELAAKLSEDGVAWLHHSNAGAYGRAYRIASVAPARLRSSDPLRRVLPNVDGWRARSVTADWLAKECEASGLRCTSQEKITWGHSPYLLDTISVICRPGSRFDRPPHRVANRGFMNEAAQTAAIAALYGRS